MTHEPAPARRARALIGLMRGITLATLGAGLVALRILQRGEAWNDRTVTLLIITAIGCAGGVVAVAIASSLQTFMPRRYQLRGWLLVAIAFPLGMLVSMGIIFDAELLVPRFEITEFTVRQFRRLLGSMAQSFGLFLISVPAYLLPWPLPLLTALAVLLHGRRSR